MILHSESLKLQSGGLRIEVSDILCSKAPDSHVFITRCFYHETA